MLVKEYIRDFLSTQGVREVFAMSGANIEELLEELKFPQKKEMGERKEVFIMKDERNAATAAIGQYLHKGHPGVVCTTSGGGFVNTLPILAEAYNASLPLIVIAGQIDQKLEGQGGFQDGSSLGPGPEMISLTGPTTVFCKKTLKAQAIVEDLKNLFEKALEKKGPAVLFIPKNLFGETIDFKKLPLLKKEKALEKTLGDESSRQKEELDIFFDKDPKKRGQEKKKIIVILGEALQGRKDILARVRKWIKENNLFVCVTPNSIDLYDNYDSQFLGLIGVMGHKEQQNFFEGRDSLILLGCSMNLMSRFGLESILSEKKVLVVHEEDDPFYYSPKEPRENLKKFKGLQAFLNLMEKKDLLGPEKEKKSQALNQTNLLTKTTSEGEGEGPFKAYIKILNDHLNGKAPIFIDAGNTGAFCLHYLKSRALWPFYVSLGMGGMGNSLGAGIGHALSSGERSHIFIGDGSLMMTMGEIHTAISYKAKVNIYLFDNRSHGMCVTRENLFLKGESSLNKFQETNWSLGLKKLFTSLGSFEIFRSEELLEGLLKAQSENKDVNFFQIHVDNREIPPFKLFAK